MNKNDLVVIPGGAGYVGARLVPMLLEKGHRVRVVDTFWFGDDVLDSVRSNPNLEIVKGDLRDRKLVQKSLEGATDVIHLACISNDPSADLNPTLTKAVSLDAVLMYVEEAAKKPLARFIYAGSSSVYGLKENPNVTEEDKHEPLTLYGKYKSETMPYVLALKDKGIAPVVLHPGTLCGYSPRQRLDLTVNIFTLQAWRHRHLRIDGGDQLRPSLTIDDMIELYALLLDKDPEFLSGKVWNVRNENYSVGTMARLVAGMFDNVEMEITQTRDNRSYHTSGEKIKRELNWEPHFSLDAAVQSLKDALETGKFPNLDDTRYYNVKHMQALNVQ